MALYYSPRQSEPETKYVANKRPPPYESRTNKYLKVIGTIAGIIGTLVALGRFLLGEGILRYEQKPQQEQVQPSNLENIVDSLSLLQPSDEQDPN